MAGQIFINYRRKDDSKPIAYWLRDRLIHKFTGVEVLIDSNLRFPLGEPFAPLIKEQIGSCNLFLALIGRYWLTDASGKTRLEPDDYVRMEIEWALDAKIFIVPVLIDGMSMPPVAQLPNSLKPFAGLQAANISSERFAVDVEDLINALGCHGRSLFSETSELADMKHQYTIIAQRSFIDERNPKPIRLGDICLQNVFLMLGNHTETLDVAVRYCSEHIILPAKMGLIYDQLLQREQERARLNNFPFFNGPNTRLLGITETRQDPSRREQRGIVLHLGPVSWFDFTVLNGFLDADDIFFNERGNTVRGEFVDSIRLFNNPKDLRWCKLSNILTVNMTPITSDGYGLIQYRSPVGVSFTGGCFANGIAENIHRYLDEAPPQSLHIRSNAIATAALFAMENASEPEKLNYQPGGVPSPLLTAQRGLYEEVSEDLYCKIRDEQSKFKFLNLIMDMDLFTPHLVGIIELGVDRDELQKYIEASPGKDHSEAASFDYLPLDVTISKTLEFVRDKQNWAPPGLSAFITAVKYWEATTRNPE